MAAELRNREEGAPEGAQQRTQDRNPKRTRRLSHTAETGPMFPAEAVADTHSGFGTRTTPDGLLYEGELVNGRFAGLGIGFFPSGNVYIGEWLNGMMNGNGTLLYSDGGYYTGGWDGGLRSGDGLLCSDGHENIGVWRQGEAVSFARMQSESSAAALRMRAITATLRWAHDHIRRAAAREANLPYGQKVPASPPPSKRQTLPESIAAARKAEMQSGSPQILPSPQIPQHSQNALLENASLVAFPALEASPAPAVKVPLGTTSVLAPQAAVSAPPDFLFAMCGPSFNVSFDLVGFLKRFALFLFPYFSIPHGRCPCTMTTIEMEREYVVSGAALHIDFEAPTLSVYVAVLGMTCALAVLIFSTGIDHIAAETIVTTIDVIAPVIGCVVFAFAKAMYHSYNRVAHALERLDRHCFPRLATFAANCIDAPSAVCIYTWDEDGNSKVTNEHYKYRWMFLSLVTGLLVAFAPMVFRLAQGQAAFGSRSVDKTVLALSLCGIFTTVCGTTYAAAKLVDMQRQVLSRMRVLSRTAYLKGRSILRPTDNREVKFHFEDRVSPTELTQGFTGWYVTRCFVLYASTCSNHRARGASMSCLWIFLVTIALAIWVDFLNHLLAPTDRRANNMVSAHVVAGLVLLLWGVHVVRYLAVSVAIERERNKHLYLADVAGLYHHSLSFQPLPSSANTHSGIPASVELTRICRGVIDSHNEESRILDMVASPPIVTVTVFIYVCTILIIIFQFANNELAE